MKASRFVALLASLVAVAIAVPAQSAQAATYSEEVIQSGPIQITSVVSSTMSSLAPWYESGWQIGIESLQDLTGDVHFGLNLISDPAQAQGMTLEVWACSVRWVNRACSTGYSTWLQPMQLVSGTTITNTVLQTQEINAWSGDSPVWLVLRITTDDTLRSDAAAQFDIAIWGEGFLASLGNNPSKLAQTGLGWGFGVGLWLVALTVGIGLPFLLAPLMQRRRSPRGEAQQLVPAAGLEGGAL